MRWTLIIGSLALTACASSTGVTPSGQPDTFQVSNSVFGNGGKASFAATVEATQYCASLGKDMHVVMNQSKSELMQGQSELTFQCKTTRADALEAARQVCSAAIYDPVLKPLAGKIPMLSATEITVEMLSLETVPSPTEAKAVGKLTEAHKRCANDFFSAGERTDAFKFKRDLVLAELMKRRISYGNANRLLRQAQLEALNQWTEQANQESARAQAAEFERQRIQIQQQQADAQTRAAWAATMSALYRPTSTTNCSWYGQDMRCTSN
jgi:hypothetical protein